MNYQYTAVTGFSAIANVCPSHPSPLHIPHPLYSMTPPSGRPRAPGVRSASVPPGPASPPRRPLVLVANRDRHARHSEYLAPFMPDRSGVRCRWVAALPLVGRKSGTGPLLAIWASRKVASLSNIGPVPLRFLAGRPHQWGSPGVEGHTPSPHGFPVLRSISVYRHAVVNTPVARWALIARGTAYSTRFPIHPQRRRPSP